MPTKPARRKTTKIKPKTTRVNRRDFKYGKIVIIGVLFLVSLLILSGYIGFKILNQKFASAESASSYSSIDESFVPIAYVVVNDFNSDPSLIQKASLKIVDRQGKRILNYDVPSNYNMDAPGIFGPDEFGKFFALGSLDATNKVESGIEAVNTSLFKLFATEPRKYIYVEASYAHYFDDFLKTGSIFTLLNQDVIGSLNHHIYTNLTLSELQDLGKFISGLPDDRALNKSMGPDVDDIIREINIDSTFAHNDGTIAVLNGSGKPGLATFGARVVRNLGGRVIAISNSDTDLRDSMVITDNPENFNVQTLQRIFNIKKIISKDQARSMITDNEVDRADIIIIFGFDNADRW